MKLIKAKFKKIIRDKGYLKLFIGDVMYTADANHSENTTSQKLRVLLSLPYVQRWAPVLFPPFRALSAKEKKCEIAVLLLLHLNLLRQGHQWLWSAEISPLDPGDPPLFLSLSLAHAGPALAALVGGRVQVARAPARGGMGVSKVEMDGQHEKSKRSRPPRVSKTTLPSHPQLGTSDTDGPSLHPMWRSEGGDRLLGWQAVPHLNPSHSMESGEKG